MSPDAGYRCAKCGATTAVIIPESSAQESDVTLKCLQCAHIQRVPRQQLEGAGGPLDSTDPLD